MFTVFVLNLLFKKQDFEHFFISLLEMATRLGIELDPKYIISDACKAFVNGFRKVFRSCVLIMCYFHLRANLRKRKESMIPAIFYKQVMIDVSNLHNFLSEQEYQALLEITLARWSAIPELLEFRSYFQKHSFKIKQKQISVK